MSTVFLMLMLFSPSIPIGVTAHLTAEIPVEGHHVAIFCTMM